MFCAGETLDECVRVAKQLHKVDGITALIDCSSEESEEEGAFDVNLRQKCHMIRSSNTRHVRFAPVKCTALVDASLLERVTVAIQQQQQQQQQEQKQRPPLLAYADLAQVLTPTDWAALEEGAMRFEKLCDAARSARIAVLLDAEQTHRQPAIEMLYRRLAPKYNVPHKPPVVYNTYQCYLRRTRAVLDDDVALAKAHGYTFAAKVVRGAYLHSESSSSSNGGSSSSSALWGSKAETDAAYDDAIGMLLQRISAGEPAAVLVATHNRTSVERAVATMQRLRVPNDHPAVHFAQILGMSDHLTLGLAQSGYNASKLVPYGPFDKLLPWLLRRLDENKDVFGAMQTDRQLYNAEIVRRVGEYKSDSWKLGL